MSGIVPITRACADVAPRAGVSLKPQHYRTIIDTLPDIGFFEVHAENYMGAGGPPHHFLEAIRATYPLSIHGVGLSLGTGAALDREHLARLRQVVRRYEPGLVSEHLAWSTHDGMFLSDLLPLPYTEATLSRVCEHVDELQNALGRQVLLENPSIYVKFAQSSIPETEFLASVATRTGCGLLLDITNVIVATTNFGRSAQSYVDAFPMAAVKEIHLAGYSVEPGRGDHCLLIDDHGSAVRKNTWDLYRYVVERHGAVPALIEWDNNVPEWERLLAQARLADDELRDSSPKSERRGVSRAACLA